MPVLLCLTYIMSSRQADDSTIKLFKNEEKLIAMTLLKQKTLKFIAIDQ